MFIIFTDLYIFTSYRKKNLFTAFAIMGGDCGGGDCSVIS